MPCASNLLIVGPLTMKLDTLMYHDESSSKQKLQVRKQQQTASGKKKLCAYNYLWFVLYNNETWYTHAPHHPGSSHNETWCTDVYTMITIHRKTEITQQKRCLCLIMVYSMMGITSLLASRIYTRLRARALLSGRPAGGPALLEEAARPGGVGPGQLS